MAPSAAPDPEEVGRLIRDVAAAEILPRFRHLTKTDIQEKASGELVTIADERAERALSAGLRKILPGSVVVGEEAVARDPRQQDRLAGEAPVWILDPVDGTYNFANGIERFVIIVALSRGGETVMGWIYDPIRDRLATTEKGAGARLEGERLHVARPKPVAQSRGLLGERLFPPTAQTAIERVKSDLGAHSNLRCIGMEYLQLAAGDADIALSGRLYPWDHAAGVLLHQESGGYNALLDGRAYAPTVREGILILAPDRETWDSIGELMRG